MATRITYRASTSFEYDVKPVQTYRAEIVAANGAQALRRAFVGASKAFPKARPRSVVVVLEELGRVSVEASASARSGAESGAGVLSRPYGERQ